MEMKPRHSPPVLEHSSCTTDQTVYLLNASTVHEVKHYQFTILTVPHSLSGHLPTTITKNSQYDETYSLQISVKLTNEVFLVPTLTTWGGFMTNFLFSPATISGFFSRIMLNTRFSNCKHTRENF